MAESFDLPSWQTQSELDHFCYQLPSRHRISQLIDGQQQQQPQVHHIQQQQLRQVQQQHHQQQVQQQPARFNPSSGQLTRTGSFSVPHRPNSRSARHQNHSQLEQEDQSSQDGRQQTTTMTTSPTVVLVATAMPGTGGSGSTLASASSPSSSMYRHSHHHSFSGQQQQQPKSELGISAESSTDMYYTQSPSSKRVHGSRSPMALDQHSGYSESLEPSHTQSPTTYSYPHSYLSHYRSNSHSMQPPDPITPPINSSANNISCGSNSSSNYPAIDTSSPRPPAHLHSHLSPHVNARQSSSNPTTPLSFHPSSPASYYPGGQPMAVDPSPPRRRACGFRRVRTLHDLHPRVDIPHTGRRMAADGFFLSPLRQLTTNIVDTYRICNPQFRYESAHNPRRVLTKPSKPSHNEGFDNEDYDYILYVNDWLGTEEGHKYLILDILGQGTFGQVVKCQNMKTHEIVAVKVVKNKPAYFNQSMMEVTILEMLNKTCDPNDEHHILRLRDSFIHRNHLCLVFELLSSNLYELIKQNQFQGLSTQLVKVFMAQLLDAMTILKDARLIHCDLKPENILLKSLQSPQIKVIDFGSACHERQTVYTYIQSRFYRSPEVLLGMGYNAAIDIWSLGCIAVELFLGLPLFPGTSEYNQLTRIIDMLGMPPMSMLNTGKQTLQFFDTYEIWNSHLNQNEKKHRLKNIEQYSREHGTNEQPGKQYFKATTLPEIINAAPMPVSKTRSSHEVEKELNNRAAFIDFCQGLLNLNPVTRWTPQQARMHPFITGEKWSKPFIPDGITQHQPLTTNVVDPKRPYGGLVPSQPKGTRAYQDAAAYNHHLAQHQTYTAHAQAQAAATFRNPYIKNPQNQPHQQSQQNTQSQPQPPPPPPQLTSGSYNVGSATDNAAHQLLHQSSSGQLNTTSSSHYTKVAAPPPPPNIFTSSHRARANTINHQLKEIPPALARLQRMDNIPRDALTPVLNRDDAIQEWERRQSGKQAAPAQSYPQVEYLQQQAEIAAASGGTISWATASAAAASVFGTTGNRYCATGAAPPPPSKLSHSFQPQATVVDDDAGRRDIVMSNIRSTGGGGRNDNGDGGGSNIYSVAGNDAVGGVIPNQSQVYASSRATGGNRFAPTYVQSQVHPVHGQAVQQQQHQGNVGFDPVDHSRPEFSTLYTSMPSDPYSSYSSTGVAAPAQTAAPSFYGAPVVSVGQLASSQQQQQPPSQQKRNLYSVIPDLHPLGNANSKEGRRGGAGGSSMDSWTR